MGWNDHLEDNSLNFIATCPKCEKQFMVYETEQTPGCRDKEELICPYCKHVCETSMEYEYITKKIERK